MTRCEAHRWPMRERRCADEAVMVVENAVGACAVLCADHADMLDWPTSESYMSVAEYVAQREDERSMAQVTERDVQELSLGSVVRK